MPFKVIPSLIFQRRVQFRVVSIMQISPADNAAIRQTCSWEKILLFLRLELESLSTRLLI